MESMHLSFSKKHACIHTCVHTFADEWLKINFSFDLFAIYTYARCTYLSVLTIYTQVCVNFRARPSLKP